MLRVMLVMSVKLWALERGMEHEVEAGSERKGRLSQCAPPVTAMLPPY